MYYGIIDLLLLGMFVISLAALAMSSMVNSEPGPVSRLKKNHHKTGPRNTPTVWNTAFQSCFFWDGRAASLEEQAKGPLINPIEMGMPSLSLVESRVQANASYQQVFADIYGKDQPITIERIAEVIASYERSLVTVDTPYDRFVKGE